MFWKDHVSTYLACNKKFAEISGVTSPQNIIGKNDYELAWRKEQSDKYISDDHAVVSLGCAKLNMIESISQADGKETLNFTSKFPIYSSNKNKQGLFGMITPIDVCPESWLKGSNLYSSHH
jgi:hypothetical protein